jgi:hypothetical protein
MKPINRNISLQRITSACRGRITLSVHEYVRETIMLKVMNALRASRRAAKEFT